MAANGMLFAVLLSVAALTQASEVTQKENARLFNTDDNTTSVTFDSGTGFIILLAILVGIAALLFGFFQNDSLKASGYAAPTAYASAPAYAQEESSYSVHRSIEEAANKYQ
ncbi:uncharacterized protein LOC122249139 [Penaeus japonicus]|uniref:uncharacterized protein LOC122249139 n=1 Tax=Penaeus japonicus TaxID=27405 RepID=UPI001C715A67|nr:uncharacterized protein LOC122249139 [Penaeus japonicus]